MNTQYKQQANPTKGFTIIEVVLVLAIAGLIFLMVFIALPSLQRGQRDAQRKQDLARIQTQIQSYASNARGNIPADLTSSFVANYLGGSGAVAGDQYKDPQTNIGYTFESVNTPPTAAGHIGYYPGHLCPTDGSGDPSGVAGTARQYGLVIKLEGQTVPYCVDSQ
jgi:prepilin-type N-terminal cleavage/methylation domain-containing protein